MSKNHRADGFNTLSSFPYVTVLSIIYGYSQETVRLNSQEHEIVYPLTRTYRPTPDSKGLQSHCLWVPAPRTDSRIEVDEQ